MQVCLSPPVSFQIGKPYVMSLAAQNLRPQAVSPQERVALRSVHRAVADLRRGDVVLVAGQDGRALAVRAAETVDAAALAHLRQLAGAMPHLVLTARRAAVLGLTAPVSQSVAIPEGGAALDAVRLSLSVTGGGHQDDAFIADLIGCLADPTQRPQAPGAGLAPLARSVDTVEAQALLLARLARLLPAVLVAEVPAAGAAALARTHDLLRVAGDDLLAFQDNDERRLRQVVEAAVPLADSERTRLVAFRADDGGTEHLAIIIGDPRPGDAVLTRLHSECFTGDLLGSLRCDCGPQLRGAIAEIAAAGSGVLLYLAQEGRNIGLMNKLRAYRLQDQGIDTVDANLTLGFEADERTYRPAATMLRALGFDRVRLMTNNPDKLAQLARWGIEVVDRVPHIFAANGHNAAYLRTKAEKAGHML